QHVEAQHDVVRVRAVATPSVRPRAGGDPVFGRRVWPWVPAFAGTNGEKKRKLKGEQTMIIRATGLLTTFACALLAATYTARAADVTYERLLNPEPQNWLMHHRDFSAQRFSPLAIVNRSNVKNLKLMFAVPLGGKSADESIEATP